MVVAKMIICGGDDDDHGGGGGGFTLCVNVEEESIEIMVICLYVKMIVLISDDFSGELIKHNYRTSIYLN